MREIYRLCLKNINIKIIDEAVDGATAVIKINELNPDFVLLDLVLPEKNGFDVLSECAHLKTKFIVISSLPQAEYAAKSQSLGAIFYLEKPFKKQQFIQIVESVIQSDFNLNHKTEPGAKHG